MSLTLFKIVSEYVLRNRPNNPCMDLKMDVKCYYPVRGLEFQEMGHCSRIRGCCKELEAFLKRDNLDAIMEMMKFSVASTMPRSSLYNNGTVPVSAYLSVFPHTRPLVDLSQNG